MNYELSPIQWRARIGALCPADGAREAEREHFMPPGTMLHATAHTSSRYIY